MLRGRKTDSFLVPVDRRFLMDLGGINFILNSTVRRLEEIQTKIKVGFEWEAVGGTRIVTGVHPSGAYLVTFPGDHIKSSHQELVMPGDIEFEIRKDKSQLKSQLNRRKKEGDEKSKVSRRENTYGFTDKMSGAMKKRAINALLINMRINGQLISRKKYIEQAVSDGVTVGKVSGLRALKKTDGSFMWEKDLTKNGYRLCGIPFVEKEKITKIV